jgi:hypothetical protein
LLPEGWNSTKPQKGKKGNAERPNASSSSKPEEGMGTLRPLCM